jgi:hypothetical protein
LGDRRVVLGAGKVARPHPAAPELAPIAMPVAGPSRSEEGLVMLCVRVAPSPRRRLKLASATTGRSIQALATEAFEAACMHADV